MATTFTPGPWRLRDRQSIGNAIEAFVDKTHDLDDGYRILATYQDACVSRLIDDEDANRAANGHLIAAAPEMHAALNFILEHIADPARGPRDLYPAFGLNSARAIEMVRAALAKAEGR